MIRYSVPVLLLVALAVAACSGGGGSSTTTPNTSATRAATVSAGATDDAEARAVISAAFATVLGDLLADEHPDGADSPLLAYLPDIHGFDHYSTFEESGRPAFTGSGAIDSAGKIARQSSASGESASLIAMVIEPSAIQLADRIASALRSVASADLGTAITSGHAAKFGLTVESLRMLKTDGLGDAAVGFELVARPDPNNPWTPSLGAIPAGGATLRVVMLVRGGRMGAILRVGRADVNRERPGGADPDLALASILDAKLQAAK